MNLTKRTKLLIGIASAIATYVMFAQKDPQTIQPAKTVAVARTAHGVALDVGEHLVGPCGGNDIGRDRGPVVRVVGLYGV